MAICVQELMIVLSNFDGDTIVEIATGGESGECEIDGVYANGHLVLCNSMELGLRGESKRPEHHTPLVWEYRE
jgi:hypothetical protein